MREITVGKQHIELNGRPVFLRGTLECAIFPLTGYPPTDTTEWMRIFRVAQAHGLNNIRFHSWCPPEAAFEAGDILGMYLHVECSSWANSGSSIGDGKPIDQFLYDESERIVKTFGNHPSFCIMLYGNEPAGINQKQWLADFITYWKKKDNRRLYSGGAGWPAIPENDFHSLPEPRIQRWGEGLNSIINKLAPRSDYDWKNIISPLNKIVVSHEIGQWCVYPDFKEMSQYSGVLKPKNFEIFKESLEKAQMGQLADSFLLASGKLQALCYKTDIEAALRTPDFGGFQLLDLHDFPGQGTALVGVLNPFWKEKGYISPAEYKRFCNSVVPLLRLPKMIFTSADTINAIAEIANFGENVMEGITPSWKIVDQDGIVMFKGYFETQNIPIGNGVKLGEIVQSLSTVQKAVKLKIILQAGPFENDWDIWVYPSLLPDKTVDVLVTQTLDKKAIETLKKGGKVLLTPKKGSLKAEKGGDIAVGFSSIFWNTAWTGKQAPHTLGILCNPLHSALNEFPTEYFSNWQWWDAMSHSNSIILTDFPSDLKPIVRIIDDWFTNRPLGLIFEVKAGNGKLMVSGIDLLSDAANRPEARQMMFSLLSYMAGDAFNPVTQVSIDLVSNMYLK